MFSAGYARNTGGNRGIRPFAARISYLVVTRRGPQVRHKQKAFRNVAYRKPDNILRTLLQFRTGSPRRRRSRISGKWSRISKIPYAYSNTLPSKIETTRRG